jgi:hypothetical protein
MLGIVLQSKRLGNYLDVYDDVVVLTELKVNQRFSVVEIRI